MKRNFFVFIVLCVVCLFVFGCGGPSSKEQAQQLVSKYVKSMIDDSNELGECINKYGDWSKEMLNKTIELKEKSDKLLIDIGKEAVNDEVQPILTIVADACISYNKTLDYSVVELKNGGSVSAVSGKAIKAKERMIFDIGCRLPIAMSAIEDKSLLTIVTYGDKGYMGSCASNVNIAVTKVFSSKDAIGDYYHSVKPSGKFVIVKTIVENLQRDAITVDGNCFKLIDKENRVYGVSTDGMLTVMMERGADAGFLSQQNPNVKREYKFVFDVPEDMQVKDMKLQARGGFSGDSLVLPLSVNSYPITICQQKFPKIVSSAEGILENAKWLSEEQVKSRYNKKSATIYGEVKDITMENGSISTVKLAGDPIKRHIVLVMFDKKAGIKSLKKGDKIFVDGILKYYYNQKNDVSAVYMTRSKLQ